MKRNLFVHGLFLAYVVATSYAAPKSSLSPSSSFGNVIELLRDRLTTFLWDTFGSADGARPIPVALGVQASDGVLRTLVPNNTAVPVKMSATYEGSCKDAEDSIKLGVYVNPNLDDYPLAQVSLSCDPGGPGEVRIEQSLDLDKEGRLVFSLEDLTGSYPAHTIQQYLPNYERLVGLFNPFQDWLHQANNALLHQQNELETERTSSANLNFKLVEVQNETESASRELWDCMRKANSSEQQIQRTAEKLAEEKKARQKQTSEAKKAKEAAEKVASTARGDVQRKEAEVSELNRRVKDLKKQMKALGKEAAAERHYLEDQRRATEEVLQVKTLELDERKSEVRWWSGIAGFVSCMFAVAALLGLALVWKRGRGEDDESGMEGSAKRERRRLLKLLSRVREAREKSADNKETEPTKASKDDAANSVSNSKPTKEEEEIADAIFPSTVVTEKKGAECLRRVRIQCPGVVEADITIKVIFNGVEVHIDRKASPGLDAIEWMRRFVFPADDGHFVFKDSEARLKNGMLEMVCFGKEEKPRIFRFPEHFDMADDDFFKSD